LLKIHAGEESVATRMLLLMFLVWTAATIGSSGIESLLFSRYGPEALPYLFIVIGVITLPAMARLGALLQRPDRRRVLSLLPLTLGAALAAGRALMLTEATWVYPVLWLLMMVVWIMEATGAWAVASLVNDTRQAKRLFPLYGAGQIVGGAAGGLLTVPLARVLHAENLIFIWAAALVAATFLVRSLFRSEASRSPLEARMRRAPTTSLVRNVQQGLRLIKSSTLLVWLAVAMVLFALLYNSLSFVFAEAVTARFANTDSLAAFIGLFNAIINGAALIVSLFVANRLFARFGIATMVLTLTVIYLIGFAALTSGVGFVALVSFRLIQMVWVNGVWITGWQALFTIVPPERRGQVTSFMEGVAWEGGMMLAGLAIIVAEIFRGEQAVFAIGVGGSALLMVAMWRARRAYGPAVADAVREGRPDVFGQAEEPFGGFKSDASAVSMLVQSAGDPDADVRRVAVAIAADLGTPEVLPAILAGAVDDDPEVRALALESLARHPDPSGSAPAAAALSHGDASVRAGAVDALVACSGDRDSMGEKLRERLTDDDSLVRARALVGLVRTHPDSADRRQLVEMLRSPDPSARGAAVVALGDLGERDLLEEALSDAHPDVRKSAVRAITQVAADGSPRMLISALWDPDAGVRNAAGGAIASLGSDAVPLLEEALDDPRTEPYALRALRDIGGAHAGRIGAYARAQVEAATHYGRLASMLGTHTDERIELLAYSLKSMMAQHAENALWAIASVDNVSRLGPAIESLTSSRPSQRATALEAIEALGASEVVRPLLAVWEREPDRRRDIAAVLDELLSADDPWLRACAALASQSVPGSMYVDRLRSLTRDSDEVVRDTATLVLEGVEMETLDTLPVMKRLLFLRKAALFAELTPSDLKSVAEAAQENFYTDGEVIAAQGEPGGEMHVVVTGEIEVDLGRDDSRMELARRGSGEVVGEMSLITEEPRMASLVAVGDVRTLSIDRPRFERILVERPKVSLAVMRELCARLTESLDRAVASH
jgi:HEAT repeat protein